MARHTPKRTRDFQCPMCPSRFFTKSTLTLHIPCHTREKVLQCRHCDHVAYSSAGLYNHVKHNHEKTVVVFKCSVPGCTFSTKWKHSLPIHQKTHDPGRPMLRCRFSDCPFGTPYDSSMKKHYRSRHGEDGNKKFICPLCTKALTPRSNLMTHISRIHTQEEHYRCEKCEYVGKSASSLRGHWRNKHENDNNWKNSIKWLYCKLCPQRVRQKGQLRRHEKTVHAEGKEFKCPSLDCYYETNYSLSFNNHVLRHEEDPQKRFPFPCSFPGCDFRRRYKEQMASHELEHETSGLELKCKLCPGKRYPDRQSLFLGVAP